MRFCHWDELRKHFDEKEGNISLAFELWKYPLGSKCLLHLHVQYNTNAKDQWEDQSLFLIVRSGSCMYNIVFNGTAYT